MMHKFLAAMQEAGITPAKHIAVNDDGKVHRFSLENRPGKKDGWYVLHTDGPDAWGAFGNWRIDQRETWSLRNPAALSNDERVRLRERQAEVRRQVEAEAEQLAIDAAEKAASMLAASDNVSASHGYVVKKDIKPVGARQLRDMLIVPIYRSGELSSLQVIQPDGRKTFLTGGRIAGGYCQLGQAETGKPLLICEGWATGCTLHQAVGYPVAVAFNAGNLVSVAKAMRKQYPEATLILCADDDHQTAGNPGLTKAREAAKAVAGLVSMPDFGPDRMLGQTDFNDLHQQAGIDVVRQQVSRQPPAMPAPANDNHIDYSRPDWQCYVNWLEPFNDITTKGKPLETIENLRQACERLGVTVRYNVIAKDIEILIPGMGFSIDNEANATLGWLMSACVRFGLPTGKLDVFLCCLADQNPYNPVAEWVNSRPWDGVSRLQDLYNSITAENEDGSEGASLLKETLIRRWLISAVAAAYNPNGVDSAGVLVLQGDQYLGKTAWFKTLAPKELGILQDGLSLRPDDKDSVKQAVSHWLVELGELDATFRKADISALKAFITRDRDTLRLAYARKESKFARRTVFFASVNPRQFLHDPTGNRRYWTISCTKINSSHGIDMQQLWAEVYETLYKAGESWKLSYDEVAGLNVHNTDYEVLDPIRERLQTRLDWQAPVDSWRWMTATDVMLEIGFDRPNQRDVTRCAQLLSELNGDRRRRSHGKNLSAVPPKMPY